MRNLILFIGLLSVAACGGDNPPTGTHYTHIGTWNLRDVNFKAVPVVIVPGSTCGGSVIGGRLIVRDDATYDLKVNYGPAPCVSEYVALGTYRLDGEDLILTRTGGTMTMSYIGHSVLWVDSRGDGYVFVK